MLTLGPQCEGCSQKAPISSLSVINRTVEHWHPPTLACIEAVELVLCAERLIAEEQPRVGREPKRADRAHDQPDGDE